jgi:hypothetical protein
MIIPEGNASRPNRHKSGENTMFQEIIFASLLYIFIIGLLYAPKCPRYEAAGNAPIDYFPDAFDENQKMIDWKTMLEIFDPVPEPVTEPIAVAVEPITEPVINLTIMTSAQLKAIAKERKIKGYGSMKKSQLIAAISG